jgi:P27 family predicted phage terminase small subunit
MKRLPTATKALRGTLRPDRTNPREPKPKVGAPPARRDLPAAVKVWYRRIVKALPPRVATVADGLALELGARAFSEYDSAVNVIAERGLTYEAVTVSGAVMQRARPEAAIAANAWQRAARMLEGFGLTPASRSKVEAVPAPEEDGFFATWMERKRMVAAQPQPTRPLP